MEEEDRAIESCAEQAPRGLLCAGVTVAGTTPEAEGVLIGQQQWQTIHERSGAGQSIAAIARDWTARQSGTA